MSQPDSSSSEIHELIELFRAKRPIAVLTGAGISTDSGIPDYRGAGSPPRTPMNIAEFLGDDAWVLTREEALAEYAHRDRRMGGNTKKK